VEKHIDADTFVILDSLNYIKGYRYELHCMVRTTKTRQATIYCETNRELCQKINEEQNYENAFPPELFEDFCNRLEVPNQGNRWDSPLFILREQEETPVEEIF